MSLRRNQSSRATAPTVAIKPAASPQKPHLTEGPNDIWVKRPQTERHSKRPRWLYILLGIIVMGSITLFIAMGAVAYLAFQSDYIIPGIKLFGLDIGGRSTAEATTILSNFWDKREITLDAGENKWQVPPETIGITFDIEATIKNAYHQGRSFSSLEKIIRSGGSVSMLPVWEFNASSARTNLDDLAPQLEVLPVDAGLQVVNGRVETTPPKSGLRLDVAATMNGLTQNPAQVFTDGQLQLVTVPVQPAITDVSAIAQQANQLLSTAVSIHAFDPITGEITTWEIAPQNWVKWLTLEIISAESGQFNWLLDSESAKAFLETQVQTLGEDRYLDWDTTSTILRDAITNQKSNINIRIYHYPTQHTVQSGETYASIGRSHGIPYPWIQKANPGVADSLSVGQILTIPSPDDLLPLPVVEDKRIVVSISQQRMWVYENGNLIWEWIASTGIDSSPTSPGIFQIQSHETNAYAASWDLWMPYFIGIYRPVPSSDFMNGFHGFPTRDGAKLLWTGNLGQQVTYGCILISTSNAAQLFEWAEEGVIVDVQP